MVSLFDIKILALQTYTLFGYFFSSSLNLWINGNVIDIFHSFRAISYNEIQLIILFCSIRKLVALWKPVFQPILRNVYYVLPIGFYFRWLLHSFHWQCEVCAVCITFIVFTNGVFSFQFELGLIIFKCMERNECTQLQMNCYACLFYLCANTHHCSKFRESKNSFPFSLSLSLIFNKLFSLYWLFI